MNYISTATHTECPSSLTHTKGEMNPQSSRWTRSSDLASHFAYAASRIRGRAAIRHGKHDDPLAAASEPKQSPRAVRCCILFRSLLGSHRLQSHQDKFPEAGASRIQTEVHLLRLTPSLLLSLQTEVLEPLRRPRSDQSADGKLLKKFKQ